MSFSQENYLRTIVPTDFRENELETRTYFQYRLLLSVFIFIGSLTYSCAHSLCFLHTFYFNYSVLIPLLTNFFQHLFLLRIRLLILFVISLSIYHLFCSFLKCFPSSLIAHFRKPLLQPKAENLWSILSQMNIDPTVTTGHHLRCALWFNINKMCKPRKQSSSN